MERVIDLFVFFSALKDYDNLRSSEVNEFRIRMRYLAEETLIKRSEGQQLDHLRYQYPPRLADEPVTPITLRRHLNNDTFRLVTYPHYKEVSQLLHNNLINFSTILLSLVKNFAQVA